ncbi:DNA/RNA nuclease SfsA [Paenibacillus sp. CC-CFT747]|nr:DNA/RNA nuclease SfsA [Paenibacillus sp. CC-CFT747]
MEGNRLKDYNGYEVLTETAVEKYKADLLLVKGEQRIIVEAKGVISSSAEVLFPQVHTERGISQLYQLKDFLLQGKEVHYFLVVLSPFVKSISLLDSEYKSLLYECLTLGLKLRSIKMIYTGKKIKIDNGICINY